MGWGGDGGSSLIYTWAHFVLGQFLDRHIWDLFFENEYFGGYDDFMGYFWG